MNKIEEFYKEAGGIEYDKFDKKAENFTYYDMIGFADAYHSKQLIIADVSNSFICVKDQEPPKNTELIAQDTKGGNYLTSWRESYKIFMCQNKQEDSSEWKWKQI